MTSRTATTRRCRSRRSARLRIDDRVVEKVAAQAVAEIDRATARHAVRAGARLGDRGHPGPNVRASRRGRGHRKRVDVGAVAGVDPRGRGPSPAPDHRPRQRDNRADRRAGRHRRPDAAHSAQRTPGAVTRCGLANRLLAVLVALALIALAVLVPVKVVWDAFGKPHWVLPWETWTRTLATNTWQPSWARAVLIGVAVVGLLLLAELKSRRPGLLPLARLTDDVQAGTTRRSLQQTLRRPPPKSTARRGRASRHAAGGSTSPPSPGSVTPAAWISRSGTG